MDPSALRDALRRLAPQHLDELGTLVRIPSVSAHGRGIEDAARAVASLLERRGLRTQIRPTDGHPVVCAWGGAESGPTLLFYEHYDVQPSDPDDEWSTPPFEVTEREGKLFGRGVADTKGHIVCRLAGIDAVREIAGGDPVRYAFLVEGEEEIGSPHLEPFIRRHASDFRADGCLWEFGGVDEAGRPVLHAGLKGILALELRARGPARDAHSSLGAVIDNPVWRLAAAVASLRDASGRVLVDGFYDDVQAPGAAELACLQTEPDPSEELRREYGVSNFLGGAEGFELKRRLALEPCVNVNGLYGGYGGPGSKTVLPSRAVAKLDVRLVADQRPERIAQLVRAHLDRAGFNDVELEALAGEGPGRTPVDDPFVGLVRDAARLAYGVEPVLSPSSAATGPAAPFREILGVPFVTAGVAYPGSRGHAPDEHIRLEDFELGCLHTALVILALGGL